MGKQILNRRENVFIEDVPPTIANVDSFLTATDYASSSTGGTVKVDGDYGIEVTSAGKLRATIETAEDYTEASDNLVVSKGTLDNVIAALPQPPQGCTVEKIFEGSVTQGTATEYTLEKAYTDYKLLVFCSGSTTSSASGTPCVVANLATGANNNNASGLSSLSFRLNAEDATKFSTPQGTGAVSIKIFGIK